MVETASLENRIQTLEAIEAIKRVKSRYWRCLNLNLWDEMEGCFAKDAIADFPAGRFQGWEAIIKYISETAAPSRKSVIAVDQSHNPEIEITDDKTAMGIWQMYIYRIDKETNTGWHRFLYHYDDYVKEDAIWKIKHTRYNQIFKEKWNRDGLSLDAPS